jgi:hypothetical protein
MKKIFIFILLLIFLTSCWNKEATLKKVSTSNNLDNWKIEKTIDNNISNESIKTQREEISLDDISKIYGLENYTPKNKIEEYWVKFIKELNKLNKTTFVDNINWWIDIDSLDNVVLKYPKDLVRNFNLELTIKDFKTKNNIEDWMVYLNWVKLWSFKDWKFNWKFKWLKWIEKFNILIRSKWFWDWFLVLNSINSEWTLLMWNIFLKKSTEKEIKIWEKQEIILNDTIIWLNECSIVNKKWECVKWIVKLKINHITWKEANNYELSLNRDALTKEWEIVKLLSGGMSYIDFIDENWEILKLRKWEKIKISYKITKKDIELMSNKKMWTWDKEWYWFYDKNKWIRLEWTWNYILDKDKMLWTVETANLY